MVNSSQILWDSKRTETFVIFNAEFNVQEAKKLIIKCPRPINKIVVEKLLFISSWPTIFRQLRDDADLSVPIIMIKVGRGYMPIDGWHRIHKAIRNKVVELPFVALTSAETKEIQI